ncbi:complement resistance protein TraT [Rhodoferax mekongensis]|uniref:Complement resistance protein TraT n=1 Tax=Rhodoferax mekongensis TaxID=3068341 RepID=A0ABZ0AZ12_9BURK|nr:complement resistance protein TraT [Rhodoferax sp. TBRC 17307]WNO03947.1 complement resistance protein TraT [Rhodoferax sp. TBRC 17307]
MIRWILTLALLALLNGCASQPAVAQKSLQIGSATSRNLFVDSSQFANRTIKLRLRNSSGDPEFDVGRLRQSIESGLRSAGYEVSDQSFGIVMDVNAFQFRTAAVSNVSSSSGIGLLLGGVAGYEIAKRSGDVGTGSGAILGAVAGAAIEEIIRNHGTRATYLALCDVNIGIVRKESTKNDRFIIGGNKIERAKDEEREKDAYTGFATRDTVRVAVYAGDDSARAEQTTSAIVDRLGRVIANLL